MLILAIEELKAKYEAEALKYITSNRSAASNEGFMEKDWKDIASAKSEVYVQVVQDLTDLIIASMRERQERVAVQEKRSNYKGMIDDYVENGDYVNE